MRRLIAYLAAMCLLFSCVVEGDVTPAAESLDGKPVTVTFSVPDITVSNGTKAMAGDTGDITAEPYLDPDMLYLVVCGHSQSIKYIRKAELVETIEDFTVPEEEYPLSEGDRKVTLYKFRVQLELSDTDRTIHFLGNVDENQLITGSYSYQILPSLLSYQGKQAYWQKVYMPHIKAKTDPVTGEPVVIDGAYVPDEAAEKNLQYIPLIRNYAKIQVSNASDNFKLHSYSVIYYPKRGSIVPFRYNTSGVSEKFDFDAPAGYRFSGYERCSFDTLEETIGYQGNMPANVKLDETIPPASEFVDPSTSDGRVILYDKDDTESGFYIYERGVPTETLGPTFIIVCGKFEDDDNWYYYRLDLMETKVEDNHSTSRYYPIYRNFCYNIQVHRISSEGVLTPEAAANSSGIEDISADISMRHLADISNGTTRLVVEPFMTRTYSGPAEDGYYELYARFFNNVNSDQPNLSTVAVRVELEPMTDGSDDILILYDGNGNPVPKGGFFFPEAGTLGGVEGIRLIRFNTKDPGDITKMQKIKITGHKPGNHQDLRLYREVEITLQKKQTMTVTCTDPLPSGVNVSQTVGISIPAGLPMSMFPLEFMLEPEYLTLTPDNSKSVNMPVVSGRSIATMESTYKSKPAFQFLRTLTWEEYSALPEEEGLCTFYCYFKPNRAVSATTIWVYNEYFHKAYTSFENELVYGDYFYVHAIESCTVTMDMGTGISYKIDDGDWVSYPNKSAVNLLPDQKMYISAGSAASPKKVWNGGKFSCRNGKFKIGGNIASLLVGDDYVEAGVDIIGFSMTDMFKNHQKLIDAYDLILPMMACPASGYKSMFDGCTGLVRGPQSLPATTLGNTCYRNMFYNCSSLEYAPDLPAKAFAQGAYQRMFWHCAKLSHVKMMGTTWRKDVFFDGTTGWCDGVAATGEIWLDASLQDASNWATTWGTIVPAGWTVKYVGIDDIEP